ncbi:TrkA C-terminal domain-containing protein, partial [Vibrio parahaemolyticus]|nr:TrkA C-terminal domain-containing protein [Vibrio parahaemolyticus]
KVDGVQVLGFKRGPEITKAPDLNTTLEIGDLIIVVGPQDALANKLKSL